MSTRPEPARHFLPYPKGEPQPITVPHLGLQYWGEVVAIDRWDSTWGRPLEDDSYFRIVLLGQRGQVPGGDIQDSRIAVCIPARGPSRGGQQLDRELASIRETQALYMIRRDAQTSAVRSYLERQQAELEGRLMGEEAARYAGGRIESPTEFGPDLTKCFSPIEPGPWFQEIAGSLLSWAYPELPLQPSLMPRPLVPEDVPGLYEAMVCGVEGSGGGLAAFGPGLGLSSPDTPGVYDPSDCRVFQLIRAQLQDHPEGMPWTQVQCSLAHASGLTRPLATLYLLAFVHRRPEEGLPEPMLVLAAGHSMRLRDGAPFKGRRLTREFIPLIPWDEEAFSRDFAALRYTAAEAAWSDALPYTSLLCQGLTEAEDGSAEALRGERELLDSIDGLSRDTLQAHDVLRTLSGSIPSPNLDQINGSLNQLSQVCSGGGYARVYELARSTYDAPGQMARDLELLGRLLYLGDRLDNVVGMKAYLEGAVIQAGYGQLSLDRTALMEELSLPVLLDGPQGWSMVRAHIREFQTRYGRAYVAHHSDYQRQAAGLVTSLEDSRLKLHALTLLNSIPELGEAVGTELVQAYDVLEQRIGVCSVNPWDLPLTASPRCASCQMALGEAPPTEELEQLLRALDRALGEQNRRLSRLPVGRILEDRADQRLDNFLKIVQASDLSGLSNTLSEELAQFIGRLLRIR